MLTTFDELYPDSNPELAALPIYLTITAGTPLALITMENPSVGQDSFGALLQPAKKGERIQALFIPDGIWHTVRYAPGTVLNVVASVEYDRSYYVEKPEDYFVNPEALEAYRRDFPELQE